MPTPTPLAVVLIDIGSTKKLTASYVVQRVMPAVQQHRLGRLTRRLTAASPTHTPSAWAFHKASLFAHTHVCGFSPREPLLQHDTWVAAWTAQPDASADHHDSTKRTETQPPARRHGDGARSLFGPPHDASSHTHVAVPARLVSSSAAALSVGPAVVAATPDCGTTHLTELDVPERFAMERFCVDAFIPTSIQLQEGARHVLRQFTTTTVPPPPSTSSSLPNRSSNGELAILAMVCPDHELESYKHFIDDLASEDSLATEAATASDRDGGTVMLLFDATHGLRHARKLLR